MIRKQTAAHLGTVAQVGCCSTNRLANNALHVWSQLKNSMPDVDLVSLLASLVMFGRGRGSPPGAPHRFEGRKFVSPVGLKTSGFRSKPLIAEYTASYKGSDAEEPN